MGAPPTGPIGCGLSIMTRLVDDAESSMVLGHYEGTQVQFHPATQSGARRSDPRDHASRAALDLRYRENHSAATWATRSSAPGSPNR